MGLAALALEAAGVRVAAPTGYPLRGGDAATVKRLLDGAMARAADARPGDVLLVRPGPGQLHLGVRTAAGMVHADLGIGRVVERPGAVPWPVLGIWRAVGE